MPLLKDRECNLHCTIHTIHTRLRWELVAKHIDTSCYNVNTVLRMKGSHSCHILPLQCHACNPPAKQNAANESSWG